METNRPSLCFGFRLCSLAPSLGPKTVHCPFKYACGKRVYSFTAQHITNIFFQKKTILVSQELFCPMAVVMGGGHISVSFSII